MSGPRPGRIRPTRHVRPTGYKGIKGDLIPLGTLAPHLRLHFLLAPPRALQGDLGAPPPNSFGS
jgi:hypothetical protein